MLDQMQVDDSITAALLSGRIQPTIQGRNLRRFFAPTPLAPSNFWTGRLPMQTSIRNLSAPQQKAHRIPTCLACTRRDSNPGYDLGRVASYP